MFWNKAKQTRGYKPLNFSKWIEVSSETAECIYRSKIVTVLVVPTLQRITRPSVRSGPRCDTFRLKNRLQSCRPLDLQWVRSDTYRSMWCVSPPGPQSFCEFPTHQSPPGPHPVSPCSVPALRTCFYIFVCGGIPTNSIMSINSLSDFKRSMQ